MKLRLFRDGVRATALLLSCIATHPAFADPKGLWRGSDGGTTRISACGSALCGYLVAVVPRNDPATGKPWTDKHNPSPARQARPLAGTMVLISMRPSTPGKWSGKLYYYGDGGTYDGNLIEQGAGNLRIEGCALGLCGGENMVRVR
jgi:uncharacterized protein (DUF2147 family)